MTGYCTHSSILFPTWHRPYLALFEVSPLVPVSPCCEVAMPSMPVPNNGLL